MLATPMDVLTAFPVRKTKQQKQALYFIPSLGMETVIGGASPVDLNGTVKVSVSKIDLPNLQVVFKFS